MASSLNIQEVQLNNTFDEFRLRTNTVIAELNKFGTGSATVTVGSLETSTGLGEDGHLTVNGDLLVTGNATIEGNLTFGNAETDTISFVADIASNVLPDTPYNFSLGSATKQWQDLYLSGTAAINIVTAQSATVVNDFTVDTNTFHVDSTTNRIGILDTSPEVTLDIGSATDAIHIPVGTTAERPGSPESGFFRYNTSLSQFEGYTTTWGAIGGGGTNTFTTDIFTGDNSTTDFVLSQATEFDTSLMVFIDGVYQTPNAYDISTTLGITTLSFSAAPANGRTIVAYVVAAGVSGNNLNQNLFTGDGATVTYTLSIAPVNKNNTQVFIDGVYQQKDAYSVSGYDVTFTDPPPDQTTIEVMTFTQTEVNVPVDGTIKSIHLSGDLVTPGALDVTTDLTVTGTTTLNGNLVIGDANTDTITISSEISSSLIPSQDITYDLGASGNAWRDLYLAGSTIYIGGGKLEYNDTLNQFELKNAADAVVPVSLSANSTTDLSEGTRLYYTTGRVLSDGTSIVPGGSLAGTVGDAALQYRADGNYSGTPQQGSFYFDGLNSRLKVYTGASFIDAVPVSGGGGGATTDANATFSKYLYTIASQTNVVTGASDEVVGYTQLYIGKDYEIVSESSTDFIAFGATTGTVGETFTVDSDGTSNIADLVLAKEYEIVTAGDTDFTVIGAVDNNVGTVFTFNGVTSQSATTGTVIAEGNGTANPVLVYVVDDATSVEVYVNGIKQYEGATNDYVATTGSSVNFTYNLPVDALVDVQVYELLTNDAYYIKTETYSQAQVNTQISNALTIYDDQTASDARYVNIGGDTMTGNLDVTGTVTADGLTSSGDVTLGDGASLQIDDQDSLIFGTFALGSSGTLLQGGTSVAFDTFVGGKKRHTIASNGNLSLYEDTGTTPKLFWDASAESLGIGTAAPIGNFNINGGTGDTATQDVVQTFTRTSSTGNVLVAKLRFDNFDTNHADLKFQVKTTASSEESDSYYTDAMTIQGTSGNVGIGTSSPAYKLSIGGSFQSVNTDLISITDTATVYRGTPDGTGFEHAKILSGRDATSFTYGSFLSFYTEGKNSGTTDTSTEAMRIDASGNVGIGGASQGANLHILDSSGGSLWLSDTGTRTFGIQASGSNLVFRDESAATERMRIDASGNVGIGTDSPSVTLHVDAAGMGDIYSGLIENTTTETDHYNVVRFIQGAAGSATGYIGTGGSTVSNPAFSNSFVIGTQSASPLVLNTFDAERMRIDGSGNVLVGTTDTTPYNNNANSTADNGIAAGAGLFAAARYQGSVGLFNRTGNDGEILGFKRSGAAVGSIGVLNGNNLSISGSVSNHTGIQFGTAVISPMKSGAENDGDVDLGFSNARFKDLYLSGVAYAGELIVGNTVVPSASSGGAAFDPNTNGRAILKLGTTSTGNQGLAEFFNPNGQVGGITTNGSATAYNTSSDQRLKESILDAPSASNDIDAIQVRSFVWKADGSHQKYGMVAQELLEVAPEAVSAPEDPEEMMGVDYSKLVPMMIKAIQEQQEQIEQLKADIAVLKGAN